MSRPRSVNRQLRNRKKCAGVAVPVTCGLHASTRYCMATGAGCAMSRASNHSRPNSNARRPNAAGGACRHTWTRKHHCNGSVPKGTRGLRHGFVSARDNGAIAVRSRREPEQSLICKKLRSRAAGVVCRTPIWACMRNMNGSAWTSTSGTQQPTVYGAVAGVPNVRGKAAVWRATGEKTGVRCPFSYEPTRADAPTLAAGHVLRVQHIAGHRRFHVVVRASRLGRTTRRKQPISTYERTGSPAQPTDYRFNNRNTDDRQSRHRRLARVAEPPHLARFCVGGDHGHQRM